MGEECWEIKKKLWKSFFFGGGEFLGKNKKRCGETLVKSLRGSLFWGACGRGGMLGNLKKRNFAKIFGGGNFWGTLGETNLGPSLKRGTRILILSLHVPSPPNTKLAWNFGGGGFLPWGQGSHPPLQGWPGGGGGGGVKRALCDRQFLWGE